MAQYSGFVKWFNTAKGFGFLGRPDGPDVFCHYSSILNEGYKKLREGDLVEFDIVETERGTQASCVVRLEQVAPADPTQQLSDRPRAE